jgi:hypothetical protein
MTGSLSFLAAMTLSVAALTGCTLPYEGSQGPAQSLGEATSMPTPMPTAAPDPILDSGPREMATGTVTSNDDGSLTYIVAEGDVGEVICDRFGLSWQQLQFADERGGATCFSSVMPGDTLNLSSDRNGQIPD